MAICPPEVTMGDPGRTQPTRIRLQRAQATGTRPCLERLMR